MKNHPVVLAAERHAVRVFRIGSRFALGAVLGTATPLIFAATTDISDQPLVTRQAVQAKPNLMFILDDSGSMNWSFMPDDLGLARNTTDEPYDNWYGYWSSQCNGVAFDPSLSYPPPLYADGTSYPNASFSAALPDGYVSGGTKVNLANAYYYKYKGTQPAMGWVYTKNGVVANTFYNECSTDIANSSNVFEKVTLTSTSADAQKYANWYSYYRKRYLLMRTAMGKAINVLDSSYRVGFSRINQSTVTDGANFRDVKDFDATQKANFYSSLYGAAPNGGTPLRTALAKAGQYFANKASGQSYDPVQYSCQRNFALLSTDGYWNSGYGTDLNGNNVGQQDGLEERPMRDGANIVVTTVTPYTVSATRNEVSPRTRTGTATRTVSNASKNKNNSNAKTCPSAYTVTTRNQSATVTQTEVTTSPQSAVGTYTGTTTVTDGGTPSAPSYSAHTYSNWVYVPSPSTVTNDSTGNFGNSGGSSTTSCQSTAGTGQDVPSAVTPPSNWSSWTSGTKTYSAITEGTPVAGTPNSTTASVNGTPNTLADVAQYYYATDLRTSALGNCTSTSSGQSQNVCDNILRSTDSDSATWQHMNTFTIGLGVSGTLTYDRNYLTQTSGSYVDLKSGAVKWPAPAGYNSGNGGGGDATNVDDLWHAAVNGRGRYYSALNAGLLAEAIQGVVTEVQKIPGAAAAAATSSVDLVAGESNQVYRASYTSGSWTGDLQAFSLNGTTGAIGSTAIWSASRLLGTTAPSSRKIYFKGASGLQAFTYANLSSTQQAYFDNICSKAGAPAQCSSLSSDDKAIANTGANLVNYLRGVRTFESSSPRPGGGTAVAALYRNRESILGDIINGAPVRVGKPPFAYADTGYADFVTTKATRKPVVYVGANDGMLHAFSADSSDGGTELWAYVPTAVMPNLFKLANTDYASRHQYYVDGPPIMADIKVGTTWKTILVGGLGNGGAGYYALDITDPLNPQVLWEFTAANMGMTYGNPVIGKKADGTWVVAFTSGYNNTSGDGKGHLYVVNANTGAQVLDIPTTAGSSDTPSGLAKINAWIESRADNTIKRIYGGDLQGNLWRFDIDNLYLPNQGALQLAKFQINTSTPQPITIKPEMVLISQKPVVVVSTGRYLGTSDIGDTTQQTVYAVKDQLTATGWGDVRADTTNFVKQTLTLNGSAAAATTASITNNPVDWSTKGGWWFDLPHSKERVATNMTMLGETLVVGSAIPTGDACASGGSSWLYNVNVTNGGQIGDGPVGTQWSSTSMIAGMTLVRDANGNIRNLIQNTDGTITQKQIDSASTGLGSARRTSWRELVD
ncbi:pilus assembly protein [Variovorax atrisoli]|uniref:pilus assembly protein n=1 Tax=Variovorax atrisoli TaxID=3394203 RepID=UPI003396FC53